MEEIDDNKIDITEDVATKSLSEIIYILMTIKDRGFTSIYFDGYNACLYAIKSSDNKKNL